MKFAQKIKNDKIHKKIKNAQRIGLIWKERSMETIKNSHPAALQIGKVQIRKVTF